ncbi:hypothetical protein PMZ80_002869 [Knufia obscura]|uniref:F-box domain-containing protein n=1 Tax=Knufia obscura TaxID=1635080 RepID=A0ABR0RZL7_9EURO|nr:hypothetical protein PMZ80_002869 [Knufia obscura]
MAATPEPKGINKVPNEILVKIFAFVPFVPSNSTTSDESRFPSGSHDQLRQVDSRFRNVIDSPAHRLKTVRYQLPEVASLWGVTSVSSTDLLDFWWLDSRIRKASDELTEEEEGDMLKHIVIPGLYLLVYMSILVDGGDKNLTNAYLLAWARKDLFCDRWRMVLRLTARQVRDHFYTTDSDWEVMVGELGQLEPGPHSASLRFIRLRTLEAALLTNNHSGLLHETVIAQDDTDFRVTTTRLYWTIRRVILRQTAIIAGLLPVENEEDFEEACKFTMSMEWRILSDDQEPGVALAGESHIARVLGPVMRESFQDFCTEQYLADIHRSARTTMDDFKQAGIFLRRAHQAIRGRHIPEDLTTYIERLGLFDLSELYDGPVNVGNEDVEEDTNAEDGHGDEDNDEDLDSEDDRDIG